MGLVEVTVDGEAPREGYPWSLPAVRSLPLRLATPFTVLVGDNGTGKSTLVEAIAVAAGFNAEGGSRNATFETTATHSPLADHLGLGWAPRLRLGWFLRAESFYNVASYRDEGVRRPDDPSYHEMSHGESFLQVAATWFEQRALFLLDEPEAALSFTGQLGLVDAMLRGAAAGAQFLVATHSPVLMALPGATLLQLDEGGITRRAYDDLEVIALWRDFLEDPELFLRHLG